MNLTGYFKETLFNKLNSNPFSSFGKTTCKN